MKIQGGIVWMAMAMQVSTRLWLGGVLSTCRDTALITALMQKVRACALCRPLLFCMDGCPAYIQAIRSVFREAHSDRQSRATAFATVGRHLHGASGQAICRQTGGCHSASFGVRARMAQVQALVQQTQGGGTINTAYIERLNATFRSRILCLGAARSCTGSSNDDFAHVDVFGWLGLQLLHLSS